jgi:2'-5' RNA ligase
MSEQYRYAIYYSPRRDEPLAEFGRRWFGFDTETRAPVAEHWPIPKGFLRTPARYGFHATLKAPFRLRAGRTEGELMQAVENLADRLKPVDLGQLMPKELGSFITLQQAMPNPEVDTLAFACVRDLDLFRQPLTEEEQDRILDKGITRRQKGYVFTWGYPYVDKDYIFHMTLTTILAQHEIEEWKGKVIEWGAEYLAEPAALRDLCVFAQPAEDEPFELLARFPLKG